MNTITPHGWSAEEVTLIGDTLKYVSNAGRYSMHSNHMRCMTCDKPYEEGQLIILVRDSTGKRRAAYCSVQCQRAGFFEGIAKSRLGGDYQP